MANKMAEFRQKAASLREAARGGGGGSPENLKTQGGGILEIFDLRGGGILAIPPLVDPCFQFSHKIFKIKKIK